MPSPRSRQARSNNQLDLTAHSAGSLGYSWRFACGPQLSESVKNRSP
jgi:hypothetical protein